MIIFQLDFEARISYNTISFFMSKIQAQSRRKKDKNLLAETIVEVEENAVPLSISAKAKKRITHIIKNKRAYLGGGAFVASTFTGNILNYIFNAYLGRVLTFNDFALIGLVGGFYSFASIFFGAYSTTVNYRSGYLIGKYGDAAGYHFWKYTRKHALYSSFILMTLWLLATPFLMNFFHTTNIYLFIFFSVVLLVGFINNINQGFLFSKMMFGSIAVINLADPIVKLATIFSLIFFGLDTWTFSAIPVAVFVDFIISWILIHVLVKNEKTNAPIKEVQNYSKRFLFVSLLSGLSTVGYFTFDIFLAKHFLSPTDAGEYALVSLIGKMIFFLGSITSPFIIPIISRYEGAKKNSSNALYALLASTTFFVFLGFILFGVFGSFTLPILYGAKAKMIVQYVFLFTLGMALYTISNVLVNYYLARKIYIFTILSSFLILLEIGLILLFHDSVRAIVTDMSIVLGLNLVVMLGLHVTFKQVKKIQYNKLFIRGNK